MGAALSRSLAVAWRWLQGAFSALKSTEADDRQGWPLVDAASAGVPWHMAETKCMRASDIEQVYPLRALHKELFDPLQIAGWFVPPLLSALSRWQASGDARDIDIERLPGVRLEAPGIVSFQCLTVDICEKLLAEVDHYGCCGLPGRAPNSMNNYGLVLNEIGMRPVFTAVLRRFLSGIGARLFGDDSSRVTHLHGQAISTHNWGGSTLDHHHTFVVRYSPEEDRSLDMHVDDCDVTFNVGLTSSENCGGSDLAFCGMRGSAGHRRHLVTYRHERGRCVVHSGKHRHGALNIERGDRSSLIMWASSSSYRMTEQYQMQSYGPTEKEQAPPDLVCLSRTHDWDFSRWSERLTEGRASPTDAPDVVDDTTDLPGGLGIARGVHVRGARISQDGRPLLVIGRRQR
mmetsp:Transcript_8953/g.22406  ORF Transcript_8953/g.22406 Transcript_8953/m.22406 type:complete len:402 (-) Transcript_8953:23-1228(-)